MCAGRVDVNDLLQIAEVSMSMRPQQGFKRAEVAHEGSFVRSKSEAGLTPTQEPTPKNGIEQTLSHYTISNLGLKTPQRTIPEKR